MNHHPIACADAEVRALLAGRQTQARRPVAVPPVGRHGGALLEVVPSLLAHRGDLWDARYAMDNPLAFRCPYGAPGDRLWVREAYLPRTDIDGDLDPDRARHYVIYRADDPGAAADPHHWHAYPKRWRGAGTMPRWASRLTLVVTAIRVARLQAITPEDARATGVAADLAAMHGTVVDPALPHGEPADDAWRTAPTVANFARLWDGRAPAGARWADDPLVWVVDVTGPEVAR